MYLLIRKLSSVRMAVEQLSSMGFAWIIAEIFYKFHSFTLEVAAFLATWFVIDWVVQMLSSRLISAPSVDT